MSTRSMFVVSAVALLLTAPTATVHAQSGGIQITQNRLAVLIQRDIGNERWAINASLRDQDALFLSGNVFRPGGAAAFLWCQPVDVLGDPRDLENNSIVYNCFGTDRCNSQRCPGWDFIREVTLPGTFFIP